MVFRGFFPFFCRGFRASARAENPWYFWRFPWFSPRKIKEKKDRVGVGVAETLLRRMRLEYLERFQRLVWTVPLGQGVLCESVLVAQEGPVPVPISVPKKRVPS